MKYSKIQEILSMVHEDIAKCSTSPDDKVSYKELKRLEGRLSSVFRKKLGVNFKFPPNHFLDRANDKRNPKPINICQVREILLDAINKYATEIKSLKSEERGAVLKSMTTDINIPFELSYNKRNKKVEFVPVTIMMKKGFKSKENTTLKVK